MLVDTPGFNDTNRPNTEILRNLLEWLEQSYRKGVRVTGILYLHPITSVRMMGTDVLSLSMLQQLCGTTCFSNICLGTSKWGLIDAETGERRERMLMNEDAFWMPMIQLGSRVIRVPDDQNSARELIADMIGLGKVTLSGQDEMVNRGVQFDSLGAVKVLTAELTRERAKLEAERRKEESLKADAERERRSRAKKDEEDRKEAEALLQKQRDMEQQAREEAEQKRLLEEWKARKDIEEERKRVEQEETETREKIAAELAAEEVKIREKGEREKSNVKRRLAFDSAEERVSNEIDQFLVGNAAGKVIARFAEPKQVYTRICCNCLNVIGSGDFFSE